MAENINADTINNSTASLDTTSGGDVEVATSLVGAMLYRTAAGYPVIAGLAFHPEEYHGDEPTNYASKETWTIESADGLELEGIHYTPENSNDKWVVVIHGYGHNHKHMYPFAGFYLANGYNVLMVDQRAAGDSEGNWLTMGTAESQDIALWTQEIARRNSDAKITLFGVSMGAATAMLAAARSDTTNVTSLVEDCGYSNVVDIINLFNTVLLHQDQEVVDLMMPVSESLTGYNLKDAAPINSISSVKIPTLFITGGDDSVVGGYMLSDLYDASGAEVKEKFIVPGAGHGVAGLTDPVGYSNTVFRFVAEADGEGWLTENVVDDISLRGTKYNDTITTSGDNVSVDTGAGNDSIYASGANAMIDGGEGSNFISVTGSQGLYVVFDGQTTVDGFNLGFGDGTDTVYIPGNPAGVDFKSGVLTFYDDNNSLTMQGVTTTAKVNLYHESRQMLNKGVFIDYDDWYSVESGDLSVKSGEEVYFVGPSATPNHGVDFSGISSKLNLTLDTAYIDSEDYVPGTTTWINGVYSIRGGAGLTTITGSKLSDTIFSGTGATTIDARDGDDYISLTSARALVNYDSGDGNDIIAGFNANSTLDISGEKYSSVKSGNNVILSVGDEKISLVGAASLNALNIIGSSDNTGSEIDNTDDHTLVTGTAYNDTIRNYGRRVTVRGMAGDDYLVNMIDSSVTAESAVANLFEGGDGNDTIFSYHSYHPTLLGGDGNDRIIVNQGHMNYIDGGAGDDSIRGVTTDTLDSGDWAMGGHATILGGDGNDYIDPFYTNNSTINGGAGNDTIIMMGADSSITGGTGDDQISLGTADSVNVIINYNSGDGNDLIQGFTENDTLDISGAQYASVANKDNLILFVGDGRLTLKGANTLDTINIIGSYDEAADSIISNSDNRVSVAGTSSNDTIVNTGNYATIQGLAGNDSIISSGANGLIFGDEGSDIIHNNGSNVFIQGNAGNDSIYSSGTNATIFSGDGSNYVSLSGSNASFVVLEGKTTVDGFTAGFGSGSDSVYVTGYPAVDFKTGGLTFYETNGDSLTLHNVTDTEKVYLHYTELNRTRSGIFIAKDDMYAVTAGDLSEGNLYFVGTSATHNHGVDFSGISQAINVTLNTDYDAAPQFWVNNVHSIIGGAGNTTITGSDEDDTIVAYTGSTRINAGGGNDHIILSTSQARVNYEAGDGNDLIYGFNENSTLNISDATFSSVISGDNVILTVGNGQVTLQGAADLTNLNIFGTAESENNYNGGDKIISDYSGQAINFNDTFVVSAFNNGNFLVQSSTGTLTIENVADKIIDLRDANGNVFVKAYTPSQAGLIDGRGISGFEIIEGSSAGTDVIFAGDGGSSLWGGAGTDADALVGGAGTDIFVGGRGHGNDNIFNASSGDIVDLIDASLRDIVATLGTDNGIAIGFNTGYVLNIQSTDTLSAGISLADGSSWRFNHSTKTWQNE